jgi:hypothetical protein
MFIAPVGMIWFRPATKPSKNARDMYEKARSVLLDRERAKIQRALTQVIDEWVDSGVSIVFDSWTNLRNQHLINVFGVLASDAMFLAVHDSCQSLHLL